MTWKPDGEAREVASTRVQYLRAAHGHEGAHQVTFQDGRTVTVLPGGPLSTQKRYRALSAALVACDGAEGIDPVAYLVGVFTLSGVPVEVNGTPVGPTRRGDWRIDLSSDGEVRATRIGG